MSAHDKKLRILSLVPYKVFPAVMGGQKGIALFYKYLSDLVNLRVITTKNNEAKEHYKVQNILSNSKARYINLLLFFTLKKSVKEHNITHLLFEHPYFAWLIFLCKKLLHTDIIVHSHNIESERFKSIGKWWWRILWQYEKWAYSLANHVWFKTEEDLMYAVNHFKIEKEKCAVIPYGIEIDKLPSETDIVKSKKIIEEKYNIHADETIILFNGTLSYKPNLDALISILEDINPLLLTSNLKYKIIICGKNLPIELNELKEYKEKNLIYAGFVEDIDLYFKACDIFLNPVQDGGGIKTKLVEAIGFGKFAVSSVNGAIGVNRICTNGRLKIVEDNHWQAYADAIIDFKKVENNNQDFYQIFSWKNIAAKAFKELEK